MVNDYAATVKEIQINVEQKVVDKKIERRLHSMAKIHVVKMDVVGK